MKPKSNTQPRSSTESKRRFGLPSPALRGTLVTCLIILAGVLGAGAALASAAAGSVAPAAKPSTPACGPNWTVIPSADEGTVGNSLAGVAAVSANNVWAVGYYNNGSSNQTLIEHWNGTAWTVVPSPNPGTGENYLRGVAAVSANDVWAVGDYLDGGVARTLIEHWNGTAWTVVSSPNPGTGENYLFGLTAVSANDVWAAGYYVDGVSRTLIEHWNGTAWAVVPSPNPNETTSALLRGVVAVSANDVWAVGIYQNGFNQTLIEHWNGTAWAVVPSPNPGGGNNLLYGVATVTANDVWAVGYYNNGSGNQTLIEHWNGTAWAAVSSPNQGTGAYLRGVAAVSANDVWAVGYNDNASGFQTLIEHWNGTAWTVMSSPNPGGGGIFSGVEVISASDVWAVGDYTGSDQQTLVERYNPCPPPSPTPMPASPTPMPPSPTPPPSPTLPPGGCSIHFSDVQPGSTFYDFVRCLACRNIVSGYADGTFRPGNNVTRGQLSKIVANAAGFNDPQTTQLFQDVPPGSTFFNYIGRLASRGYMSGYPCGGAGEPCISPGNLPYFRPNNNATRGQIAKIDANAAQYSDPPSGQQFQDVSVASTYYTYTYRLVSRSVMSGYPCGGAGEPCVLPANLPYFRPFNNATRGQTSKIVANTFFPGCDTPRR